MTLGQDIKDFNKKLMGLEIFIKEIYKIEKDLDINVGNCLFKDGTGEIIISHPDFPSITCFECDLENVEKIKNAILFDIETDKVKKRIYELKFQIDYWMQQTSPEFIDKKLKDIENWKTELVRLDTK